MSNLSGRLADEAGEGINEGTLSGLPGTRPVKEAVPVKLHVSQSIIDVVVTACKRNTLNAMLSKNHSISDEREGIFDNLAHVNNWSSYWLNLSGLSNWGIRLLLGSSRECWVLGEGLLVDVKISENFVHLGFNCGLTLNHIDLLLGGLNLLRLNL